MRSDGAPGKKMIPANRNWQKINASIQPMPAKGRRRKAIRGGLLAMALVACGCISWHGAYAKFLHQGFVSVEHLLLGILLRPRQPGCGEPGPGVWIREQFAEAGGKISFPHQEPELSGSQQRPAGGVWSGGDPRSAGPRVQKPNPQTLLTTAGRSDARLL